MSRDYKQGSKKNSSSGGGSSVLAGVLIGLCLGVAIAVAAALYLNRVPNPFAGKSSGNATVSGDKTTTPSSAAGSNATASAGPATQPAGATPAAQTPAQPAQQDGERFGFYKMLPAGGNGDKPAAQAKPVEPPKPAEATPPATVLPPKGVYLQAGAFQNESDADNLKAKLAFVGIESNIQTSELKDAGVVHRVRIGPLASEQDVERVRGELRVNGIEPTVVKN